MNRKLILSLLFLCGSILPISMLGASAMSEEIRTEERMIRGFSILDFNMPGDLLIRHGGEERMWIESTEEGLDRIQINQSGNRLELSYRGTLFRVSPSEMKILIETPRLSEINSNSSGDIIAEYMETSRSKINVNSSGGFSGSNFESDMADTTISSSGNAEVWVNAILKGTINSTVVTSLSGEIPRRKFRPIAPEKWFTIRCNYNNKGCLPFSG